MSHCDVNVRWFPFDQQECKLMYESWSYDINVLNLTTTDVILDDYSPNGGWVLLGNNNDT